MSVVGTGTISHWNPVGRIGRIRRDDNGFDLIVLHLPANTPLGAKVSFDVGAANHAINVRIVS